MSAQSNITVKLVDGVTDIVYVAMNPSSGDGVKALWRANAYGGTPASNPWLTVSSRPNGSGSARRVDLEFRYPQSYTNTTTGLISVKNEVIFTGSYLIPLGAPDYLAHEPAVQLGRILANAQIVESLRYGWAPT